MGVQVTPCVPEVADLVEMVNRATEKRSREAVCWRLQRAVPYYSLCPVHNLLSPDMPRRKEGRVEGGEWGRKERRRSHCDCHLTPLADCDLCTSIPGGMREDGMRFEEDTPGSQEGTPCPQYLSVIPLHSEDDDTHNHFAGMAVGEGRAWKGSSG